MQEGKVLSMVGGVYSCLVDGKVYQLKPRGIFRHKNKKLLIGDNVQVDIDNNTIEDIEERKNSLIRPRIANLDLGIIVMSLVTPNYSSFLLDKFLTLLNMSNVKPLIILTKEDLLIDKSKIDEIKKYYESIGIKTLSYSKKTLEGLDEIKKEIDGLTVAFMGQTGVGKSSLINILDPDFEREIGEYSTALGRGKHQTKEVILLPYQNGIIADTPGFSSLELPLFKEELAYYFPGFSKYAEECKYSNCLHNSEKGCKVKEALEKGNISEESYKNYIDISKELIFRKDRFQ